MKTVILSDNRPGRRRTRIVDLDNVAQRAANRALESKGAGFACSHGGAVANAYRYPAGTDAVFAVAVPARDGEVIVAVFAERIPANKATLAGAATAAFGGMARPIFDDRYGDEARRAARIAVRAAVEEQLARELAVAA
jgi:hypothetical protein